MVKTLHRIDTISSSLRLEPGHRVPLAHAVDGAGGGEAASPVAAVMRALAAPLDYPPLDAATVPGDHVAIAVDASVPEAASIVRGSVESLERSGIEREAISIVTTSAEMSRRCRAELGEDGSRAIQHVVHDPEDRHNLCHVAVTRHGELLVNRAIFDADVVLPIGCARLDDYGVFDSLFPQFCDEATIERYRAPAGVDAEEQRRAKVHETDEAGWLIGAPLVMRVVPGTGEAAAHVLAGDCRSVARRSQELCREQWLLHAPRRASLVIATITGGDSTQNWQNVARSLAAAERLVEDDGAVAICSNLSQPPGKSLGRLVGSDDLEVTERRILNDRAEDTGSAWQLARALQRGPVYLLSQLDAEMVEDMGLAPVADVEEIVRLASRHESCIVLDDSQHAIATVEESVDM